MEFKINYEKDKFETEEEITIQELNKRTIRANKLTFKVDALDSKRKLKKDIKKVIKYRKWLEIKKEININIYNFEEDNLLIINFANLIEAIAKAKNIKDLYNRVYILACDYLDLHFYSKNVCDFCDNKCGGKRETDSVTGCCHYFANKLGPLGFKYKLVTCKYLQEDGRCSVKSIGCKLFTCDYLNKKGIKFRIRDMFVLDTIFNPIQKVLLIIATYTPQEITVNKLLKVPNLKFVGKFFIDK